MWLKFLETPTVYCRPFIDFSLILNADQLDWYTDASGIIGIGGIFQNLWFQQKWDLDFIEKYRPSITYLELHAVCVSLFLWMPLVKNRRIRLFCDNEGAKNILNSASSKCKNCMVLVRKITLLSMIWNCRVFAEFVPTKENYLADALSRFEMDRFWKDVDKDNLIVNRYPCPIPEELWPLDKLWLN